MNSTCIRTRLGRADSYGDSTASVSLAAFIAHINVACRLNAEWYVFGQ
uniref:Uncharacterized protein n=1 Tax=Anguilla anguilla TaxID=7936 RepID=A0A0E9WTY6_ANGAN